MDYILSNNIIRNMCHIFPVISKSHSGFLFIFSVTPSDTQGLLLTLRNYWWCFGDRMGCWDQNWWTTCRASALPAVVSLWPHDEMTGEVTIPLPSTLSVEASELETITRYKNIIKFVFLFSSLHEPFFLDENTWIQ